MKLIMVTSSPTEYQTKHTLPRVGAPDWRTTPNRGRGNLITGVTESQKNSRQCAGEKAGPRLEIFVFYGSYGALTFS